MLPKLFRRATEIIFLEKRLKNDFDMMLQLSFRKTGDDLLYKDFILGWSMLRLSFRIGTVISVIGSDVKALTLTPEWQLAFQKPIWTWAWDLLHWNEWIAEKFHCRITKKENLVGFQSDPKLLSLIIFIRNGNCHTEVTLKVLSLGS